MKLQTAIVQDPDAQEPRLFLAHTAADLTADLEEFYEGAWEDDYASVRAYLNEEMTLIVDERTLRDAPSAAAREVGCPRHGGHWGSDETCVHCVDEAGNTRRFPAGRA